VSAGGSHASDGAVPLLQPASAASTLTEVHETTARGRRAGRCLLKGNPIPWCSGATRYYGA
jgi:hypothetical protein